MVAKADGTGLLLLPLEITAKVRDKRGCGEQDHAGSCIRYNKAWHKNTGIPLEWIRDAGHNSNTDKPEAVNSLIERVVKLL